MREIFARYIRLIKFGIIGCINTAVDFLVFSLVSTGFAMAPSIAQAFGYCAGIICSFILNHRVTFSDAKKETASGEAHRVLRFVIINGISLSFSVICMDYLTDGGMWAYLAKIIITVITMVINYLGYKIFVFKIKGDNA